MLRRIIKDDTDPLGRAVPVYLTDPGGAPYSGSLGGATVSFRRPDGVGGDIDVSGAIALTSAGRWLITLTTGQIDTSGVGWVDVSKPGTIAEFHDFVEIYPGNADVKALLPGALEGGFIKAQVKGIDATPRDAVAGAVHDVAISAHRTAGTFGELAQKMAGLSHLNVRIDNLTFDAAKVETVGRMRCFDSAAHASASTPGNVALETGELFRFAMATTTAADGKFTAFVLTET